MTSKLLVLGFLVIITSCKQEVRNESNVYNNDFEASNLSGISNGIITQYNNTAVLGQYNNSNFILKLDNLPPHDLITISFDLYLHDSWDGNKLDADGPDIWKMLVDGNTYINTTFSNDKCIPGYFCSPQSYPADYPNNYNNPRTGAARTDLPGVCSLVANADGTTMYKIVKTFKHSNSTLVLQCLDKLVQSNSSDPKCDESWSVDNISIKAVTL